MVYDEDLAARIRDLIGPDPELTEKKMFGGLAFLIRGHMAISAAARAACWLGDSAIRPHALTSLITQAGLLLPQAVHDARVGPHTLPPNRAQRLGAGQDAGPRGLRLCACGLSWSG